MRYQEPFAPEYGPVKAPYQEVHYAGTSREQTVTRYANGLAFVSHCMIMDDCDQEATQVVTSQSFCLKHAEMHWNNLGRQERLLAKYQEDHAAELAAEARAEQEWEMRANGIY